MNGTLASNVKRQLYPALEQSQGFTGDYSRQGRHASLTAIPTTPEWMASEDTGLIEEWIGLVWIVSVDEWSRTGFDVPTRNDRFTVTMADGVLHRFAVLAPKGLREYDMPAGGHGYNIRMKWVKE